jgi:outer membrane protein OmpA-like peptidoglycan-associated protein
MPNRDAKALLVTFGVLALFASPSWGEEDMPGSRDHPEIPRIEGTHIVGYGQSPFDEGEFITGIKDRELQTVLAEGKRTRIVYLGPPTVSPLMALRNYQAALGELGAVEEVYSCRKNACPANLPKAFFWGDANRVDSTLGAWAFDYPHYYKDQVYWYGTLTGSENRYHVSVYASVFAAKRPNENLPSIHLEILEEADFEPTLKVVTPDAISETISKSGSIALYGILFDLDSATLKAESKPTLESVAKALRNDPALNIYVVGHTDDQGAYEYNLDLSARRAASVVTALVDQYGVDAKRLKPVGVGPVSPVASNANEEGRASNRRVELVKF